METSTATSAVVLEDRVGVVIPRGHIRCESLGCTNTMRKDRAYPRPPERQEGYRGRLFCSENCYKVEINSE